jgi:hypothetical protein
MNIAALALFAVLLGASSVPQQAGGTWWDRTAPALGKKLPNSRYYTIRSDLGSAQTKQYADHLDTMYGEFTKQLIAQSGLRKRSPEYPNVLIFAKQQDYLDTLRTQFGINGTGSGGMFFVSPRGAGLAFWVEGLPKQRVEHVIQHEGFHQFAYAFFGNEMPPWLNEGLAEFFGEAVVEGSSVIIGQASPQVVDQVRKAVNQEKYIPFMDLLQMDDQRWNGNVRNGSAGLQYMQSWSMVQFLVYGEDGKYGTSFTAMLKLLNDGTSHLTPCAKHFHWQQRQTCSALKHDGRSTPRLPSLAHTSRRVGDWSSWPKACATSGQRAVAPRTLRSYALQCAMPSFNTPAVRMAM